ncbi:MAG: hypothetical protein ACYC6Y_06770, partial [Thermoguttaceae bacterium]
ARCKEVIRSAGRDGGYILDASAIVQRDAKVENIRAMTEAALEFGVYSRGHATPARPQGAPKPEPADAQPGRFVPTGWFVAATGGSRPPGVCIPWDEKLASLPPIRGDEALCRRIWQSVDALGAMYIWWIVMAF